MSARDVWRRAWLRALPLSGQIPFDEWLELTSEEIGWLLAGTSDA